ncbi:MAG: o-succinylbenzoate synthase [Verrucomicrobia bacterium]|nr:o-succinylbenzoate synthase [Verrucomicrobiota bacterium]
MEVRFEFRRYRAPFRVPVRTAHGWWPAREGVIVRLEQASGVIGWGEAAPIPWFGTESVDEVVQACAALGATTSTDLLARLPTRLGCLRAAVASALATPPVPRHPHLAVAALLPAGRGALEVLPTRAELGFRTFKWKVGVGPVADELALLDDVCAALPAGARLRLDANGAWDGRQAQRWLERCAERPVEFVEQPCLAPPTATATERSRIDDLLLGLAADFPTPLALDESVVGDQDVVRWLGAGWPGWFVVKPALVADLTGTLAALSLARARVVFSSALETAIGARAALRAAFAWEGTAAALGFGVFPLFENPSFDAVPAPVPFLRVEDVVAGNEEALWNALS